MVDSQIDPQQVRVQQITYYRIVKPPTLEQYVYRRAVSEIMKAVKGNTGTAPDPDTGRLTPVSAIKAKGLMKGIKARDLVSQHPDWVAEYHQKYPKAE